MDAALTAAAIGVGGTVIVGLAGFWANVRNTNKTTALALRTVELTEQGQVTDRYSKAIEQLSSDKLDVRVGGIYALERITRDSPRDHPTIMEVLAAFIRDHSREQWPPAEYGAEPPERATRPDVQAAATVIGRRTIQHDSQRINLADADLIGAHLARANLTGASLYRANLTGANLYRADLTGADLTGADLTGTRLNSANLFDGNLTGAYLTGADLTGTFLAGAYLTGAYLAGANLSSTYLDDANLTNAVLDDANLTNANLRGTDLTGVNLTGTNLTGAIWPADAAVPEGWQREASTGRLYHADPDSGPAATATPA
jgi:hypothetical protein